jgi:cell division septation protein DedD
MKHRIRNRVVGVLFFFLFLALAAGILFFMSSDKNIIIRQVQFHAATSGRSQKNALSNGTQWSDKSTQVNTKGSHNYTLQQYMSSPQKGLNKSILNDREPSLNESWVMSVGSFSQKKNANKLLGDLKKSHYNAYLDTRKKEGGQGVFYRVMIGPELDENVLEYIKHTLQTQMGLKHFFVKKINK